jgi:hypothetical protein
MKTRWTRGVAFLAVLALGAALGVAADRFYIGGIPSNRVTEEFKMSVGVSTSGLRSRPTWQTQNREAVNVPQHYGRLVSVSSDADFAVFWYQDEQGRLRNVMLERPADTWYMIDHIETDELKETRRK